MKKKPVVPVPQSQPPYWWIAGRSFAALKGQFVRASELARLEVRKVAGNKLTFVVVDPAQAGSRRADQVDIRNSPVDDTFHCPPFCA